MFSNLPVFRQIYSTLCANLLTISFGATTGWTSINFVSLQKVDTIFPSGPLSLTQATRVVSIFFACAVIGNLLLPHIARKFGVKTTILALGIPQIMSWLLIIFAQNPYYLYASRALAGLVSAGVMTLTAIFATEICNDGIRGTLMSIFYPFMNIGAVMAFLLGKYFNYADQATYLMIPTILFVILFAWIPETPVHLLKVDKLKAANQSHTFFKGTDIQTGEDKHVVDDSKLTLSDFTNRRARKAIFIAFWLVFLNALQGFTIVVAYIANILEKSNPNTSTIDASILISAMLIVANLMYTNLVHCAGRRVFYVGSAIAATIGHVLLALYLYFLANNPTYDWVPIVALSYILFVSSLGMNPVSWLLMMEIFPTKIKTLGYSTCIFFALMNGFIFTELYPPIEERIGLIGWITFFAVACSGNALFGIFIAPETKGKSHEEIMELLD